MWISPSALRTILKENVILGPDLLETKQTFIAAGGGSVEKALATAAASAPVAAAVADGANVAAVITALKAMGIFVDPPA